MGKRSLAFRWLVCAVAVLAASAYAGDVVIEKVEYAGWQNNVRMTNGEIELIATLDVGPRIMRLAFVGGPNVFKEYEDQLGKTGEKEWQIRGGHRLWHAPEAMPRTYFPDNDPVKLTRLGPNGIRLTPPPESTVGVQKEIDLFMDAKRNRVRVVHRITNVGMWTIRLSPWAMSVMAPGGVEIIPLPPKIPHGEALLPNQVLVIWTYTDLSDPRYTFGSKYILLRQDPTKSATKIGLRHAMGWVAYLNKGVLFVKRFKLYPDKPYPDFGCNFETFTRQEMLEVESLGPLTYLKPGKSVEHVEVWELYKNVPPVKTEADVDRHVLPLVSSGDRR